METKKQYFIDISIIKAIALLFITWFHFKWSVPEIYRNIFIGGAIGNSLFSSVRVILFHLKKSDTSDNGW